MKKFFTTLVAVAIVLMVGCSTITTTTYYKEDGSIDKVIVEQEISDANALADYLRQADKNCATDRSIDINKFNIGYADIGISWLSIGGNSTKAPAKEATSEKVLVSIAEVKKAGKTTLQTESVGVNTDAKNQSSSEDAKE